MEAREFTAVGESQDMLLDGDEDVHLHLGKIRIGQSQCCKVNIILVDILVGG